MFERRLNILRPHLRPFPSERRVEKSEEGSRILQYVLGDPSGSYLYLTNPPSCICADTTSFGFSIQQR